MIGGLYFKSKSLWVAREKWWGHLTAMQPGGDGGVFGGGVWSSDSRVERCLYSLSGECSQVFGSCSLIYRDLFETLTTVCHGLTHCVSITWFGFVVFEQQEMDLGSRSVTLGHKLSWYMGSIYVVEWYILLSYVSSTLLRVLPPRSCAE